MLKLINRSLISYNLVFHCMIFGHIERKQSPLSSYY